MSLENMVKKYVRSQAEPNQPQAPQNPAQQTQDPQNPENKQSGFVIDDNKADAAKKAKNTEFTKKITTSQLAFQEQQAICDTLEKTYTNYQNLLENAKKQLFNIDISRAPNTACEISQAVSLDSGLITIEEFSEIYGMWKNAMVQSRNSTAALGNLYSNLMELINQAKEATKEDLMIPLSDSLSLPISKIAAQATQTYNNLVSQINGQIYNYQIQDRSYKMFVGIYPVKLEFVQHMNALCQVEIDYEYARDTLKFGGLDLVKTLEDGFNQAALIVDEIAGLVIRYNPTVFGKQQALLYKNIAKRLRLRAERFIIEYNSARK